MERLPTLWCFARETGGGPPFQVNIHEAMTVSQLKQTIKTEMAPLFDMVTYNNLVLYKMTSITASQHLKNSMGLDLWFCPSCPSLMIQ